MCLIIKGWRRDLIIAIVILLLPFFITGCKPLKDEERIKLFFSFLCTSRYDEALKLTEDGAKDLLKKLTKDTPQEITDAVFKNLALGRVLKDELMTSQEKKLRVYRVNYHIVVKKNSGIASEVEKLLSDIKTGEIIVCINKKTGKIKSIVDLKGNVFVVP